VRCVGDRIVVGENAVGQRLDARDDVRRVLGGERPQQRLVRAFEQAVGDLDARRAGPEGGERVDQLLRLVVALHVRLRRVLLGHVVGLVVDDQVRAVRFGGEHVDEAAHERAGAVRVQRELEPGLARDAGGLGEPPAQR